MKRRNIYIRRRRRSNLRQTKKSKKSKRRSQRGGFAGLSAIIPGLFSLASSIFD